MICNSLYSDTQPMLFINSITLRNTIFLRFESQLQAHDLTHASSDILLIAFISIYPRSPRGSS